MNETLVDSWGYRSEDGNFTGMVGLLQRREVDIGGVSLMTTERLNVLDYTPDTITFRPRFVFRQPSLSSVSNIYVMPFSDGVWVTYIITVVLLTVFMFKIQQGKWRPENIEQHSRDWSEIFLNSLGTTCQQGWQKTPEDVSSRIIFMCLDVLSIFFFTSYSAIIVSLLQSPSSSINNIEELLNSPMKIALYDIIYNHNVDNYMNISASPVAQRLLKERVWSQPRHKVYITQDEGMELVRRGKFAFHVEVGAYKYIADTWLEAEKCDLVELYMFPPSTTSLMPVPKLSPYTKILTTKLRRVRESGLQSREKQRWGADKPHCHDNGAVFISVGLQDFKPVLLILSYGIVLSIIVLLIEFVYYHAFCITNYCKSS